MRYVYKIITITNFPKAEKVILLFQKRICNVSFLWITDSYISRLKGYDMAFVSHLLGQKSPLHFSLFSSSSSRQAITTTSFSHELFKAIIPSLYFSRDFASERGELSARRDLESRRD